MKGVNSLKPPPPKNKDKYLSLNKVVFFSEQEHPWQLNKAPDLQKNSYFPLQIKVLAKYERLSEFKVFFLCFAQSHRPHPLPSVLVLTKAVIWKNCQRNIWNNCNTDTSTLVRGKSGTTKMIHNSNFLVNTVLFLDSNTVQQLYLKISLQNLLCWCGFCFIPLKPGQQDMGIEQLSVTGLQIDGLLIPGKCSWYSFGFSVFSYWWMLKLCPTLATWKRSPLIISTLSFLHYLTNMHRGTPWNNVLADRNPCFNMSAEN